MKLSITAVSVITTTSLATAIPTSSKYYSSPPHVPSYVAQHPPYSTELSPSATPSATKAPRPSQPSRLPLLCKDPTQSSPPACSGNLLRIDSSSNASLIGLYAYLPAASPSISPSFPVGENLSFTRRRRDASTFSITVDVYGETFLNASQTNRFAFWSPATQKLNAARTDYEPSWPVNFLNPLYGSTRITPSMDGTTRAAALEIQEYGSRGQLQADAKLLQVCGSEPPVMWVTVDPIEGCANVTMKWI